MERGEAEAYGIAKVAGPESLVVHVLDTALDLYRHLMCSAPRPDIRVDKFQGGAVGLYDPLSGIRRFAKNDGPHLRSGVAVPAATELQ